MKSHTLAVLAFALIIALFLSGCASQKKQTTISSEAAVSAAQQFVKDHVKFFSRNASGTIDLPSYQFNDTQISEAMGLYTVTLHVSATLGNETKVKTLNTVVDKATGEVVTFNNQSLPK